MSINFLQTAGCNKCIDTLHVQVLKVRMFVASSAKMTIHGMHKYAWLKEAGVVVITWFRQLVTVNLTQC